MNFLKSTSVVIIILSLQLFTVVKAETKIALLDVEKLMDQSLAGKSIISQIGKANQKNNKYFKEIEKKLKLKEEKTVAQKNLLTKEEFQKKIVSLRDEFQKYQNERNDRIKSLNTKKQKSISKIFEEMMPILTSYSAKNDLTLIIDRKNVVMGKTDLDITDDILKLLNSKLKKIDLK